jgi:UDP-N-acetylglucosamine--N-acetylmuramyl-(pentapeptide) pyrophosphoryl-undecaprenol N-acetylglucosamine transferase
VGAGRSFEKDALARAGYPQRIIAIEGIKGRGLWAKARAAMKIPGALLLGRHSGRGPGGPGGRCGRIRRRTGGPGSLDKKRIPVVLCEQNTVPGITNRMLFPIAKRVYVSFENTRGKIDPLKKRITGNPVRQPILDASTRETKQKNTFTILIVGGSQGAHAINLAMMDALPRMRQGREDPYCPPDRVPRIRIRSLHAYRKAGIDAEVKAFFHDMASRYSQADLVGLPSRRHHGGGVDGPGQGRHLFIPYPFAADNHQEHKRPSPG